MSKSNDPSKLNNQFKFDQSVSGIAKREVENARASEETIITKPGVYEISVNRASVPARIRLFPEFLKKGIEMIHQNCRFSKLVWIFIIF